MIRRINDLLDRMQHTLLKQGGPKEAPLSAQVAAKCKLCGDTGIVFTQDVARLCECVKKKRLEQLFQSAGIAPELKNCDFESFRLEYYSGEHLSRARVALQGARQFVQDFLEQGHARGLLFSGSVGSGKTYLAAAVANALLAGGVQVLFLTVPDFLDEMRATYHKDQSSDTAADDVSLLKEVRQAAVLVLDDLGAHNYTEWTRNKLYSLLNFRLNYQLPVIITTNLFPKELDVFLGERTTSRIVQMCTFYRLTVSKDIRYLADRLP
jgi:DNA replication protein DnaC